jgi:hypothetical protein
LFKNNWLLIGCVRLCIGTTIPVEEGAAVRLGIGQGTELSRELGTVFEGFELGLGIRVIVGHMRTGMSLGDPQID